MVVNPNWPLVVTQVAFTTDPFSTAPQAWTEISDRIKQFDSSRGRQYELDSVSAGEAAISVYDKDEALNPSNPSSVYYPNVKVYRRIIDQAMWPPAPLGGAVNLLNSAAGGYDPSFESYASGDPAPAWCTSIGSATLAVATSGGAAQGTKYLGCGVIASSGQQGLGVFFDAIPGQTYTASVYVKLPTANTVQIQLAGQSAMDSTTTVGTWTRLVGTFSADQPRLELVIGTPNASNTATIGIDAIQIEPGSSAHTFVTSGPVIYSTFGGFVERWPSSWMYQGTYGLAQITCVDSFAPMSNQFLFTEYRNAVLDMKAAFYWPLNEPQNATLFAEASGNGGPHLSRLDSPFGPSPTFASGTQTNIPGDPSGTGVTLGSPDTGPNIPSTILEAGYLSPFFTSFPSATTLPVTFSSAFWAIRPSATASLTRMVILSSPFSSSSYQLLSWNADVALIGVSVAVDGVGHGLGVTHSDVWADGKPHLYACSVTITSSTASVTMYVDGVAVAGGTVSTAGWPAPPYGMTNFQIGAAFNGSGVYLPNLPDAAYSHVALFDFALSTAQIAELWRAGTGYPGERSGERVARYLGYHYLGPTSIEPGESIMGVSNLATETSLLDACQAVATSENGNIIVEPSNEGTITFQARTHRYFETSASWVFGENAAAGEIPYNDDINYDYDPTQVYNDVQVTRAGGLVAAPSDAVAIATSRSRYGQRSLQRTINVTNDLEAIDAADWLFAGHSEPIQRLAQLTINPGANPALWPAALGIKSGDRVTVKRRTSGGYTMSADFFIERIEQSRNDSGQWLVTYQASPAGGASNLQPWILGDSTYGVLGTTTVLGY